MSSNPLLISVSTWFRRNFSEPAAVALFFTALFVVLFLEFFGHFFMPVIISVVLAYLLLSVVRGLMRLKCPHLLAVTIVFVGFIGVVTLGVIWLLPIIVKQLQNLATEFPNAFSHGHNWVTSLMAKYPTVFSDTRFQDSVTFIQNEFSKIVQGSLRHVWALIPNLFTVIFYLILIPLLLFFFLKDSNVITTWFSQFLPKNRTLVSAVWNDVNKKIARYVRGRVIEIIIVSAVTSIAFSILGMNYGILLGILVGLSVIIPYIGAIAVTIPVFIIALAQWGVSSHALYLFITYSVIIVLDANVLVPLLFSEAMDLHPVVIILSVIVFGGIWGFWGVFFSIPLAMILDTMLRAWPRELV